MEGAIAWSAPWLSQHNCRVCVGTLAWAVGDWDMSGNYQSHTPRYYDMKGIVDPVPEALQHEIILVHGPVRAFSERGGEYILSQRYWHDVWEWLQARYPDMFQLHVYPDDWVHCGDHKHDMDILTSIHSWQRAREQRT